MEGINGVTRHPTWEEYEDFIYRLTPGLKSTWVSVDENWTCPCCHRHKFEIIRWKQSNHGRQWRWLGELHNHHDHVLIKHGGCRFGSDSQAALKRSLAMKAMDPWDFEYWMGKFRFSDTLICMDCNWAEGSMKSRLKTPSWFSFSPPEIQAFLQGRANQKPLTFPSVATLIWREHDHANQGHQCRVGL